jgi:hypothetical protein
VAYALPVTHGIRLLQDFMLRGGTYAGWEVWALAGIGALLPVGSVAQIVVLGVAAIPGLPAYLAFPVWQILAGRAWLSAEPAAGFADQSRTRTPGMSDSTRV